ncbi:Nicotinamide mononucleotide adenylyltransferase [Colletotrichum siamense]|uniref:Nicotinamide mononucleotide adenylyltransferase n=1 Tax=Colletotrichum siamense TaxID=690259 RepID=A0A9P5K4Y0_COLSI|nr:Nicotinamide mononucleotide adenylyltransferase [Colletotrichum siamense]KAF4859222.1 Nicotinamide mononucleotide adenylyltransferase [Colletotrichum siamense]
MSRKALVEFFSRSLSSFQSSQDAFRVLCTLPHRRENAAPSPRRPQQPVKRLVVLDSSFNPPTLAHLRMATSALQASGGAGAGARLLLLLAVNNADKAPKPVAFAVRLGLMCAFAEDLLAQGAGEGMEVDVGVTAMPFFHDKARAVEGGGFYGEEGVEQVYLAGYDTLIRIFNPKYYPEAEGGMKAALGPFLDRGRLRISLRVGDEWGGEGEQRAYLEGLREGGLEEVGGKREWAERVELVTGTEGEVVSSSRVREMAGRGDEEGLKGLLGERVRGWVLEEDLYRD